ncbi:MAG: hypothetical protein U0271_04195 [Polyangiaceae bacterium]
MSLEEFLPTVAAAERAGLLNERYGVVEAKKLAAIVVVARFFRREAWREAAYDPSLPSQAPPFNPGQLSSWCGRTPAGKGFIEYITDRAQDFWDVFVPRSLTSNPTLFGVESAIEALVPKLPDDELECHDLRTDGAQSAYRGQLAGERKPMFHDYDFEDTIDQAKESLGQLYRARGRIMHATVRAFAWPMLYVRFDTPEAATDTVIVPGGSTGGLHAITGAELQQREEDRS